MKKFLSISMMLVAIMVATVCFSSCGSDDDNNDNRTVSYGMGFSKMDSKYGDETLIIPNTFREAIGKVDGVKFTGLGNSEFIYSGSVDNIITACKAAEAALANEAIKGTYVYNVYKDDVNRTVIYTYMANVLE